MGVTFVIPQRYGCVLTIMSMEKNVDFLDWSGVALQTAASKPHGGNSPNQSVPKKANANTCTTDQGVASESWTTLPSIGTKESSLLDRPNCGQYPPPFVKSK